MNSFNWALTLQVKDGPNYSFNYPNIPVEAYDKVDLDVGKDWTSVNVQPSQLKDVEFMLVIRNDKPEKDKPFPKVIYSLADNVEISLDTVHALVGSGSYGLLKANPEIMKFKTDGSKASVTILIGRTAIAQTADGSATTTSTITPPPTGD
jgi:hypothetical protein